ncbi:hypothetical protein K1T71_014347 [Dendrolimus kikuchii]|uniref:Uncharacterized protein n=1 Tax=Dendrolimus kikuchii TaxID=765133 RepID=A0ACC1CDS0_9NEOP|nr:hypothetical protein K1T71_014347 [Dendrolimus kikuchii]
MVHTLPYYVCFAAGFGTVGGVPYESTTTYVQSEQRRGMGTGAAVGLGVGALAAGGLAGYALGGGFSSDSPTREEVQVSSFSETVDFGGDDWAE